MKPLAGEGAVSIAAMLALLRLVAIATAACAMAGAAIAQPTFAFHYGADPPLDELQAFDAVVLEPVHVDATRLPRRHTAWFAYVSVVEVLPSRSYFAAIPPAWLRGSNPLWGSRLIDQTAAGWRDFFSDRVIGPLWQQGWRGFFLDTLDSYHLFAASAEAKRAQEDALVELIEHMRARYPGILLIFNRGFEILPRLRGRAFAVAAESLFKRFDAATSTYGDVPDADRAWLGAALKRVRDEHGIPVIAIDYVASSDRKTARETAQKIRALGFVPWVTNALLDSLGVGDIEVQPRRIAIVTDLPDSAQLHQATAVQFLSMPLNYLGYTVEAFDIKAALPDLRGGRYAALVTWFSQPLGARSPEFAKWLRAQRDAGRRLVLMNALGVDPAAPLLREFGLHAARSSGAVTITHRDPLIGFEAPAPAGARPTTPLALAADSQATPLLRLRAENGATIDAAAFTSWGAFAFEPYVFRPPLLDGHAYWIVDPIAFLRGALGDPQFPAPDVTTEGGRRLLIVHIDGDGFASRAELPGTPYAAEVLLRDVLSRYRVPTTMSVIQGEIAGTGLHREQSPALEEIARRMFAQPYVELASHTLSHPFIWRDAEKLAGSEAKAPRLMLPDYKFSLAAEIAGSAAYIDQRLAPAGKRTRVFLWSGDCMPSATAVQLAEDSGLLQMNGGGTEITRSAATLTLIQGLGLRRGRSFQVYAPNQNENVYTNLWTGPFYGYQRAIETFDMTETPLRLKPINIYYHTYSASKPAGLAALHKVYGWVLSQSTTPVYASDYIRKVMDFESMAIARDWRHSEPTWIVRGRGDLRTLRISADRHVAMTSSAQVAGTRAGPGGRYVHLASDSAVVAVVATSESSATEPQLAEANGWISGLKRDPGTLEFTFNTYMQPAFAVGGAERCTVRADGRVINPLRSSERDISRYELAATSTSTTPARHVVVVRCR